MTEFRLSRVTEPLRTAAACAAISLAFLMFGHMPANSNDAARINDLMEQHPADTDSGAQTAPVTGGEKELWVQRVEPLSNVHLIAAQPTAGGTCREVIFARQPAVPHRLTTAAGNRIKIPLDTVCWIALRNGSDTRSLVLRLGEALQRLAIVPTPQLLVGRELRPHEQVRIALKPLQGQAVEVPLEVAWIEDIKTGENIETLTLEFVWQP